jgi:heptaprenylglyceryl phosphate synthase
MNLLQDNQFLSIIAFAFLGILLVYTIINFKESNKILRRYSHIIKETMKNPIVREFIETHRNIKVQVEETHSSIKIYWITTARYPYVIVEYDKKAGTITRARLIDSNDESDETSHY